MGSTPSWRRFLSELKRRNVYRVAVTYAVVAFVVWQVASLLFPALGFPGWTVDFVIVLTVLGLPIALVLAWALEVTPDGVRRTPSRSAPTPPAGGSPEPAGARASLTPRRAAAWLGAAVLAAGAAYGGYAVVTSDGAGAAGGRDRPEIRSLAVLPLDNFSGDSAQDYFVEGMTEALISQLGRVEELSVISRTSAMRYRDTEKRLPTIARELGVDAIVEGSVLRVGDEVRITAQLVQAEPERHLWANDYQRELRDVLALQAEVARAITREIRGTLSPGQRRRFSSEGSVDPQAYEAYLRGRYHWNGRDARSLDRALEHFREALEIDPAWARPWAGIADVFVVPAQPLPPPEALPRAKEAARRALELDSTLAEAHTSLAYATMGLDYDWETSGRLFRRALELNPSYATGHQWYAEWLLAQRRLEEAVAHQERAAALDPLSPVIAWTLPNTLYLAGRPAEALARLEEAERMFPDHPMFQAVRYTALVELGEHRAAVELMARMPGPDGPAGALDGDSLRAVYAERGWDGVMERLLATLEPSCPRTDYAAPGCVLVVRTLVQLGRNDAALDILEAGLRKRLFGWYVPWMVTDPMLAPLRTEPRYRDVLEVVNLDV